MIVGEFYSKTNFRHILLLDNSYLRFGIEHSVVFTDYKLINYIEVA